MEHGIPPPPDPTFSIEKVNTLAAPKGISNRCALECTSASSRPATPRYAADSR